MNGFWILALGLLLLVFYLASRQKIYVQTEGKPTDFLSNRTIYSTRKDTPQRNSSRRTLLSSSPHFKITDSAPPLPLSTMYAIRIGRQTLGHIGPNDPVWTYDHSSSTGPNY